MRVAWETTIYSIVQLPAWLKAHHVTHKSCLKPYWSNEKDSTRNVSTRPIPVILHFATLCPVLEPTLNSIKNIISLRYLILYFMIQCLTFLSVRMKWCFFPLNAATWLSTSERWIHCWKNCCFWCLSLALTKVNIKMVDLIGLSQEWPWLFNLTGTYRAQSSIPSESWE